MLRVSGRTNKRSAHVEYLRIPFGSFAITMGDVYHGGIYGKSGNFRFHMVVKTTNDYNAVDKLVFKEGRQADKSKKKETGTWKNYFQDNQFVQSFSERYMEILKEKCGTAFDEGWTTNLDSH